MRLQMICPSLILLAVFTQTTKAEDWVRFRGPDGLGISNDKKIPTKWGDSENLKWKLEMPGKGFSSPIVVGDKVFVTSYTGEGGNLSNLERHLTCVDRNTGKQLWSKSVKAVLPEFRSRGSFAYHGYASHTPVSDGERVYVVFGTTGVLAYDLNGEKLWQQSIGTETNAMFGSASSPILYKDFVIVTAGSESASIRAFDRKTGKEVWKASGGSLGGSYSTPSIIKNKDGEDELVISVPQELWGLNPMTGKLKWYAETMVDTGACTSVVFDGDIAYVIGGRTGGRTAVRVGGEKDVTRSHVLWSKRGGTYVPSPILHEGHLYYASGSGTIVCVDAKTGTEVASKRLGGAYYASPVLVDGKLYAVSRFNGTYVVEASPKLTQLAANRLTDGSDFSGSPAVSNGQLFIRSDNYLYCIEAE